MTLIQFRVRELRKHRGWTQQELADRAGLKRLTIINIENGKTKGVDFATLTGLAKAFGVGPGYLLLSDDAKQS